MLGLVAAFWFLVLAPKRQQASDLEADVADSAGAGDGRPSRPRATGEAAKKDFPSNYRQLITLGKAVPVDADTPSLLTQLQTLSVRADVDFRSIALGGATEAARARSRAACDPASGVRGLGRAVADRRDRGQRGPAGNALQMQFEGGFFEIADFFGRIDGMVDSHGNDDQGRRQAADDRRLQLRAQPGRACRRCRRTSPRPAI